MVIAGQPSYGLRTDYAEAWVSRRGGHVGPILFRLGNRTVSPMSVAPWAEETLSADQPEIIRVLRGDFFCMPFGGNASAYGTEVHPVHGETANAEWLSVSGTDEELHLRLEASIRKATIDKHVSLRPGETAIYQKHVITQASGPMGLGMHAMLKFNSPGLLSHSPIARGQVYHKDFEIAELGGYNSLKSGALFDSLERVPMKDGNQANLLRYPDRNGYEDLVQVFQTQDQDFAWWAVVFPEEGFVWYQLKDPRVLTSTVLWHSNGGRHYAPWSGRHRRVLGIEEVTAYFHDGLAESVAPNPASEAGFRTSFDLDPAGSLNVNVVFGVAEIPDGFGRVRKLTRTETGIEMSDGQQTVATPVDHAFLSRA